MVDKDKGSERPVEFAKVFAYISNTNEIGTIKDKGWVELNVKLEMNEAIEKISWRSEKWGANNIVVARDDMSRLMAKYMQLCEAMFTEKEQREAWKSIIKSTFYEWHDTKMYRFNLEKDFKN